MVSYQPVLHETAERELNSLDAADRERLTEAISAVAAERQPTTHEKVRALEGHADLFRIRVGDTRAICELDKPHLKIFKVGYRATVYDGIDDLTERRSATA